jgi:hypothetical protein
MLWCMPLELMREMSMHEFNCMLNIGFETQKLKKSLQNMLIIHIKNLLVHKPHMMPIPPKFEINI